MTSVDTGFLQMYDNAKQTNDLLTNAFANTEAIEAKVDRDFISVRDKVDRDGTATRDFIDRKHISLRDAIEGSTKQVLIDVNRSTDQLHRDAAGNTRQIVQDINRSTDQLQRDAQANNVAGLLSTERNGANNFSQTQKASGDIQTRIQESTANTQNLVLTAQAAGTVLTQKVGGDIQNTVLSQAADIRKYVQEGQNMLGVQAAKDTSDILVSGAVAHASDVENFKETLVQQAIQTGKLSDNISYASNAIAKQAGDYYANSLASYGKIHGEIKDTRYELSKQAGDYFAKSQMDLLKVENSLGRQSDNLYASTNKNIDHVKASLQLQASENSGKASLELCKVENSLSKQSALETAAIQMEAAKNVMMLQKQLDDCCCKIEQHVNKKAEHTDNLIQKIDIDHYRDDLLQARETNLLLALEGRFGNRGFGYGGESFRGGRGRRGSSSRDHHH